jgi:hypothetical protein
VPVGLHLARNPAWLFDLLYQALKLYQALTVGVPLFVEIGHHSLRVFTSNLNDTRVTLRLYQHNQRQIDARTMSQSRGP